MYNAYIPEGALPPGAPEYNQGARKPPVGNVPRPTPSCASLDRTSFARSSLAIARSLPSRSLDRSPSPLVRHRSLAPRSLAPRESIASKMQPLVPCHVSSDGMRLHKRFKEGLTILR